MTGLAAIQHCLQAFLHRGIHACQTHAFMHLRPTCVVGAGHGLGEELLPCWVLLEYLKQRLAMSPQERDLACFDCIWQVVPGHVPYIVQRQHLRVADREAVGI